jgi:hypothetical protein
LYWKLGPQYGGVEVVEPLRRGTKWKVTSSLRALPSEGINAGLAE